MDIYIARAYQIITSQDAGQKDGKSHKQKDNTKANYRELADISECLGRPCEQYTYKIQENQPLLLWGRFYFLLY